MHVASRERYEMNILFSLKQETHLSQRHYAMLRVTVTRGQSMSFEMKPLSTKVPNYIVTTSVSRTVSEIFTVTLKSQLEVHSRSFKMVPFQSWGTVSYSLSILSMALSCIISEIM